MQYYVKRHYVGTSSGRFIPVIVCTIFILVGLGLLIGGGFWLKAEKDFVNIAEVIDAKISNISTYHDSDGDIHHTVYVDYEYKGNKYSKNLSEYSSSMYVGQIIKVYIDPKNPGKIHYTEMALFGPIFLMAMGSIFFIVGFFVIIASLKNRNMNTSDMNTDDTISTNHFDSNNEGICIQAEILDCSRDYAYPGEKKPWRIYCRHTDANLRDHYYTSDPVWVDMECFKGHNVPVMVYDENNYRVCVESLEN